MEHYNRKSICDKLSRYDVLVNEDSSDNYVEVTEWYNGEGWDITFGGRDPISLSCGQLDAILYLTKFIDVADE